MVAMYRLNEMPFPAVRRSWGDCIAEIIAFIQWEAMRDKGD